MRSVLFRPHEKLPLTIIFSWHPIGAKLRSFYNKLIFVLVRISVFPTNSAVRLKTSHAIHHRRLE